jgi:hypothetical protein
MTVDQIEIKLKKVEGLQWTALEGDGKKPSIKLPAASKPDPGNGET